MLDWDDLRFFLAVARYSTLAGAAKQLNVTQSTVGRRLTSLQEKMGVRLFHRSSDGYLLTLAGESIRAHVERVEAEALLVERAVAGQDVRPDGLVRVSSSQLLTSHLLAPSFGALHMRAPGILIESVPELPGEPLANHDVDIVVGLRRFEHNDLVMRNIGTIAFGLYGCLAYFARRGEPDFADGCSGHQIITLLDDLMISAQAGWLTDCASRATIVLKADSWETQYWASYGSGGLALLPRFRADPEPALRRFATPTPIPSAEIWLGVHRENRSLARVRIVLDTIAETVRRLAPALNPKNQEDT